MQLHFAWPHIRNSYLFSEIVTPTDQQEKNLTKYALRKSATPFDFALGHYM